MAAPAAILKANSTLKSNPKCPSSYRFSGIEGDIHHGFGYHLAPYNIHGWDYSNVLSRDKRGFRDNPEYASAWDLSFSPSDMKKVTKRLLDAARAHDPRMNCVREFCGTLNGTQTYPWDLSTNSSEGVGSWDDSHLWHVHISFYRDICNDWNAIRGLIEVICGIAPVKTGPAPKPKWQLGFGQWYDVKKNTRAPGVRTLQLFLYDHGYVNKKAYPDRNAWCDGVYGTETGAAVVLWKKNHKWANKGTYTTKRSWNAMFGIK